MKDLEFAKQNTVNKSGNNKERTLFRTHGDLNSDGEDADEKVVRS